MPDTNTRSLEVCAALYPDVDHQWSKINLKPKYGFKILNGPPIETAEILFVGYQPGGCKKDWEEEQNIEVHNGIGTHRGWPLVCEYVTAKWRLGPKMRRVFGEDRLRQCVGTNVIFLRYPNEACYRSDVGEQRKNIEQFCVERVKRIVEAIKPKRIITIGFKALEMFGHTETELRRNYKGHALTKTGNLAGQPAVGMIHLTGARPAVSNEELDRLADRFRA